MDSSKTIIFFGTGPVAAKSLENIAKNFAKIKDFVQNLKHILNSLLSRCFFSFIWA